MERSRSFCSEITVIVLTLALGAQAQYSGGRGTAQDPYRIATAADLMTLGQTVKDYDKHFILTADIDLAPGLPGRKTFDKAVIAPLRGVSNDVPLDPVFTGVFDGGGRTIRNLTTRQGNCAGLFGGLGAAGRIVNLSLDAVSIDGTGSFVGSLVGYNFGVIADCSVAGTIAGGGYIGGLVGYNNAGSIVNCRSNVTVRKWSFAGGLVGFNHNGSIANCYSSGTVAGDEDVGGLVGCNIDTIINSFSAGRVTGGLYFGGLIGDSPGKVVVSCFWDIQSSKQTTSVHGTGLTTAQMQDVETYLSCGWDWAGESANGTADCWQMLPGQYPTLRYLAKEKPKMPNGAGTAVDPYRIADASDLGTLWLEPLASCRLEASIDLAGTTWSTAVIPWFGGSFDGNGHVIKNLRIQGVDYLGLAGKLAAGGTIFDLGLESAIIKGSGPLVGSFAGINYGSIAKCKGSGEVSGDWSVGGLAGASTGEVSAGCYEGIVKGTETLGGLVGYNTGSILDGHSQGTVSGSDHVGGLVGDNYKGSVVDCSSASTVSGKDYIGGLVGANYGSAPSSCVASSRSTGAVTGSKYIGGSVGYNFGNVLNSCSGGKVVGIDTVGGLAGLSSGSVVNSYSTGKVDGNWTVGGMLGSNKGQVSGCFWDIRTSGQEVSDGGTGKTTPEMQVAATFQGAGWDFIGEKANGTKEIWWILEGKDYPRLGWELEQE